MGDFLSPRDPIFWLHHNMVEYLWIEWNVERENPNTNASSWTDWNFDGADVVALVPTRQGISARVSRFVEFLKEHLHTNPPWR